MNKGFSYFLLLLNYYYYYYYQQRVLDVEMGSFTPLVFGTNGEMGVECQMFLRNLAEKLSKKDGEPYAVVMTWLRTRLSFEILRSVHLSVGGSRMPLRSAIEVVDDFRLNVNAAEELAQEFFFQNCKLTFSWPGSFYFQ